MTELLKFIEDPRVRYANLVLLLAKNLNYVFNPLKSRLQEEDLKILINSMNLISTFREAALKKLDQEASGKRQIIYGFEDKLDYKLASQSYVAAVTLLGLLDNRLKTLIPGNKLSRKIICGPEKELVDVTLEQPSLQENRVALSVEAKGENKSSKLFVEYVPFTVAPSVEYVIWLSKALAYGAADQQALSSIVSRRPLLIIDKDQSYLELVARTKKLITYTRIYFKSTSNLIYEAVVFPNKRIKVYVPIHLYVLLF
jgi:hypothetical protein